MVEQEGTQKCIGIYLDKNNFSSDNERAKYSIKEAFKIHLHRNKQARYIPGQTIPPLP